MVNAITTATYRPDGGMKLDQITCWRSFMARSGLNSNRQHGVRMGTSELYSAAESVPEVLDSLVIDLEVLGARLIYTVDFVVLTGAI